MLGFGLGEWKNSRSWNGMAYRYILPYSGGVIFRSTNICRIDLRNSSCKKEIVYLNISIFEGYFSCSTTM